MNGTLSERGVLAPMNSKINDPLIKELKEVSLVKWISSSSFTDSYNRSTVLPARRRLFNKGAKSKGLFHRVMSSAPTKKIRYQKEGRVAGYSKIQD